MIRKLGTKLRVARETAGLTRDVLAKAVGLSNKYISVLEAGKRRPSLKTLQNLADFLKKDVAYFLSEVEESFPALLSDDRLDRKTKLRLKKFQALCSEYLHLEEVTGHRAEPAPLYSRLSPERMAEEERRRLGLGNEPIRDIFPLVELNGLRLIRMSMPEQSMISGIFIYDETKEAAFVLVSSAHSPGEQTVIAAHEYCHFLKDRFSGPIIDNPDIFITEYVSLYHPREQFAQAFALHFLMPRTKVEEVVDKDIRLKQLRFEDVIYLKRYFGVSTAAMMQTLKSLAYLSPAKYEEFQKLDAMHFEERVFSDLSEEWRIPRRKRQLILSSRYMRLAVDAYRKKKITAEKLAELLKTDKNKILSTLR